jgi:hypothetical protein
MGIGNRITAKMLEEIHAQLKSGAKMADVARNFELAVSTISKINKIMKRKNLK